MIFLYVVVLISIFIIGLYKYINKKLDTIYQREYSLTMDAYFIYRVPMNNIISSGLLRNSIGFVATMDALSALKIHGFPEQYDNRYLPC